MKTFIILLGLFFFQLSLAAEFEAVVRTKNNRPKIEQVQLSDLESDSAFDGKYFKIVKGKSNDAISFNADQALVLRAATTYYHLTIARNYWIQNLKNQFAANLPKMIIRIDHTNQFSELGHFANDNFEPQFNNALTIPAGKGLASRGVKPWNVEIWFRPQKKVHLRDLNINSLASQQYKGLLSTFRNQIHMQSLQRFLATLVGSAVNQNMNVISTFNVDNLVRTAGSSVIMEFGYQFFDPISKATARKWYWLDTALVPEIIYHEYSHAALSDFLELSHSTAIIEGMADFFAGQIANSPKLATHIKKYNTFNGKNAKRKQGYMLQFEMTEYANTDFVFGILWQLKDILGEKEGEAFMFHLRQKINTNSSIRGELIEGLLKTCDEVCKSPFNDKLKILKALNARGL
jgi:hypothetical protein